MRAIAALCLALAATPALAEPVHVMVRAQSEDAKFIGDHTGGADVTLRDAANGTVLAHGLIKGGTGDTARIMTQPQGRGAAITDAETAGYDAVIDIARPTLVEVVARGPLGYPAQAVTVRSTRWIVPGHPVAGDGWILKFPGLLVTPGVARKADGTLHVTATVTMLCGCPIAPGGLWDAARFAVTAQVLDGGTVLGTAPLAYAGEPSHFAADLPRFAGHADAVRIVATEAAPANAGVAEIPLP